MVREFLNYGHDYWTKETTRFRSKPFTEESVNKVVNWWNGLTSEERIDFKKYFVGLSLDGKAEKWADVEISSENFPNLSNDTLVILHNVGLNVPQGI